MNQTRYSLTKGADLIAIASNLKNGFMVFGNQQTGGVLFQNGDFEIVSNFLTHHLQQMGKLEQAVFEMLVRTLNVIESKYKTDFNAYRSVIGDMFYAQSFSKVGDFVAFNKLDEYAIFICCCGSSGGVLGATGDLYYTGAVILETLKMGNVKMYDCIRASVDKTIEKRKYIN